MSDFEPSEDLPLGLMMQLGQDMDAMTTFARLSDPEKEQLVDYIKGALTGEEAKSRVEQVMNALEEHRNLFG